MQISIGKQQMAAYKTLEALGEALLESLFTESLMADAAAQVNAWYLDKGDYFDNPSSPTHGAGRKETRWAEHLSRSWDPFDASGSSFSVFYNPDEGGRTPRSSFAAQIRGATITASGKALTIPMCPEAHGQRVRQFVNTTGHRVFSPRIKGGTKDQKKDYLAYNDGAGLKVAYLLRAAVTIRPLEARTGKKPLPDESDLEEPMAQHAKFIINNLIQDI